MLFYLLPLPYSYLILLVKDLILFVFFLLLGITVYCLIKRNFDRETMQDDGSHRNRNEASFEHDNKLAMEDDTNTHGSFQKLELEQSSVEEP